MCLASIWFLYTAKSGERLENTNSCRIRVYADGDTPGGTVYAEYVCTGVTARVASIGS